MALTEKYLNQLIADKTALANNLTTKGVEASSEETFTELVPKVLDIQSGGSSSITKGLIINACDSDGYVIDAEIVGMTTIPYYYFYQSGSVPSNTLGKIETIKMSNEITSIGRYAFYYCSNLALTSLPDNLQAIDKYAFYYCSNLALTSLPKSISSIGSNAFQYCSNLALTSLPDNLQAIDSYAFEACSKLSVSELPRGITTISSFVFSYCRSLTEMTCQGVITSISGSAFSDCSNLSKFVLPNITSVPTLSTSAFNSTPIKSGTGYIYVPDTLIEDFKVATNWSTYAAQIKGISELPTE